MYRGKLEPIQDMSMTQIGWQVFAHILLTLSFQGARSYYKLVNTKIVFSILVYLLLHLEVGLYLNYYWVFSSLLLNTFRKNKQTQKAIPIEF